MLATPEVSVVMSAFNDERHLPTSVASILSQESVELELIVVDDGSSDGSAKILDAMAAKDGRVRVIHQDNRGLTRALARGCGEARGEFIARQDADDRSLPGRLRKQVDRIRARGEESLVTCWAEFVGPEDEVLFTVTTEDDVAANTRFLRSASVATHRGIGCHGTALFRRPDYERAGGYREQFYFAQDLDLWLRLTDRGSVGLVPETLYQARLTPSCVSARYRLQQIALAEIGLELASIRTRGGDEDPLLMRAAAIRPSRSRPSRLQQAQGFYFIGKCLLDRRDTRSAKYLRSALRANPLHIRAWLALLRQPRLAKAPL